MDIKRISVLEHQPYQPSVLGYVDSLPVTGNTEGDRYILSTDQTINTWYDDAWISDTPEEGWRCTVLNDGEPFDLKFTNGAWVIVEDVFDSEELPTEILPTEEILAEEFEQVQSDWEEEDTLLPSYIKNKPTIPTTGGFGVMSVTGDGVDNNDPANPVISFPDLTPYLTEVNWGEIDGDLGDQTDLVNTLALKEDVLIFTLAELTIYTGTPKKYVLLTDSGIYGLFKYDSSLAGSPDDIMVIEDGNENLYHRVENKLYPRYFGAVGDGTTNDLAAFTAMMAYPGFTPIELSPNTTYKINGTWVITKNGFSSTENKTFSINGNGARIITDNNVSVDVINIYQSKGLILSGFSVFGTVEFNGCWESTFDNLLFGRVKFGYNVGAGFESHYWLEFNKVKFSSLWVNTGAAGIGNRHEFNSISFNNCMLHGDIAGLTETYAFFIEGTGIIEGAYFNQCDISYYTNGLFSIANILEDSAIVLSGCYLDSELDLPINSKNLIIDINNKSFIPNGVKSDMLLETGSAAYIDTVGSRTSGSRLPSSSYNLVKNGNLAKGGEGYVNNGATISYNNGAGYFGKQLNIQGSDTSVDFKTIPVPFSGHYSIIVIGEVVAGSSAVEVYKGLIAEGDVYFNVARLSTEGLAVSSGTLKLEQGEELTVRIYLGAGTNSINISYVGVTYGKTGLLGAIQHPLAGEASVEGTGTVNYLSKWLSENKLGNSIVYESGLSVSLGRTNPAASLHLIGGDSIDTYTNATLALGFYTFGTYSHFIHTRHNGSALNGNAIDFYTGDTTENGVFPTHKVHGLSINNGKVGIGGITDPVESLHIPGKARLGANPVHDLDAVTKQYLTDALSGLSHPAYTPISVSLTGATVVSGFASDAIGSVTTFNTRTLTTADLGAVPITRTITINGAETETYNLSDNRTWIIDKILRRKGVTNIVNFNNVLVDGAFTVWDGNWFSGLTYLNTPDGEQSGYGVFLTASTISNTSDSKMQMWFKNNSDSHVYVRTGFNSAWNNWRRLATIEEIQSGGMTNPMTTTGDIIYAINTDTPSTPARLGIGSDGSVLGVVNGVPAWVTPTIGTGFANPMSALGDLIVGKIGGTPARLPRGVTGQILTVDPEDNATLMWRNIVSSYITSVGGQKLIGRYDVTTGNAQQIGLGDGLVFDVGNGNIKIDPTYIGSGGDSLWSDQTSYIKPTNSVNIQIPSGKDLLPEASNSSDIGTLSKYFRSGYFNNVYFGGGTTYAIYSTGNTQFKDTYQEKAHAKQYKIQNASTVTKWVIQTDASDNLVFLFDGIVRMKMHTNGDMEFFKS